MAQIEDLIKEVEDKNAKLNEEVKSLTEKRGELDRQIAALREEAIRQQGEYRALTSLLEKEKKPDAIAPIEN